MRIFAAVFLIVLTCASGALRADELNWGGTYIANWDGFGTAPYSADDTNGQVLSIFCLDFNDEIAPPYTWNASIIPLTAANVAGTGAYQNVYAAQYGGAYNQLLSNAFNSTPSGERASPTLPQVSGPAFSFTGDSTYGLDMSASVNDPYTRYEEAAWLFTDMQDAISKNPRDVDTDTIAQVAAWELFVNGSTNCATNPTSNYCTLTNDVNTYSVGTKYTFNDYLDNTSLSGVSFEAAVDRALQDAQAAVNGGWSGASSWDIVTATPTFVVDTMGRPVQEFLTPVNPVPEPGAVFLLATASGIMLWRFRRRPRA